MGLPSESPSRRLRRAWLEHRHILLPLILLLAVTLPHLNQGDFRGDTGWYTAIGWWAFERGNVWDLEAGPGVPYFNKPPLAILLSSTGVALFGASVAAARLPSILAAAVCVLLTVAIARRYLTRSGACAAGCVLALTYEFFRRTREASLDLWQLMFMLAATLVLTEFLRRTSGRPSKTALVGAIAGVFIGLGLLCKPLFALLALPIWGVWLLVDRETMPRRMIPLVLIGAASSAVAVAFLWYLPQAYSHGSDFWARHFGAEIVDRATTDLQEGFDVTPTSVWYYPRLVATGAWPWLALGVLGVWMWARGRLDPGAARMCAFGLVWILAWLALLSIFPDRRDRYALVMWPGLAWIAASPLRARTLDLRHCTAGAIRLAAPIAIVAGVIFALLPIRVQRPPDPQWAEVFEWAESTGAWRDWYDGGLAANARGKVALKFERWPQATHDAHGRRISTPGAGDLILYHRRGAFRPGENEARVLIAGDLIVTRLDSGQWAPFPTNAADRAGRSAD